MILFYFLAITDPQLLCTVCHCICWDSEDIFWQGGMSSDNLGVDGADKQFYGNRWSLIFRGIGSRGTEHG